MSLEQLQMTSGPNLGVWKEWRSMPGMKTLEEGYSRNEPRLLWLGCPGPDGKDGQRQLKRAVVRKKAAATAASEPAEDGWMKALDRGYSAALNELSRAESDARSAKEDAAKAAENATRAADAAAKATTAATAAESAADGAASAATDAAASSRSSSDYGRAAAESSEHAAQSAELATRAAEQAASDAEQAASDIMDVSERLDRHEQAAEQAMSELPAIANRLQEIAEMLRYGEAFVRKVGDFSPPERPVSQNRP
jgi:hypothetical protein